MNANGYSIIIVGSGKAAFLHLSAYLKLWEMHSLPQIIIVAGDYIDPSIEEIGSNYIRNVQIISWQKLMQLKPEKALVDICTPTQLHFDILDKMNNMGFTKFIIEKPMVTSEGEIENIKLLDIQYVVMENYMFSYLTRRIHEFVKHDVLTPKSLFSFFCKNRVGDLNRGRGFAGDKRPLTFTLESPHQLYLATSILGNAQVTSAYTNDTLKEMENVYQSGIIRLDHNEESSNNFKRSDSTHFTCLHSNKCVRRIVILGENSEVLTADYPDNKGNLDSKIKVEKNGEVIYEEILSNDDMMKNTLRYYIDALLLEPKLHDNIPGIGYLNNTRLLISAISSMRPYVKVDNSDNSDKSDNTCLECKELCFKHSIEIPCQV